jgi:hypothetical protein
MKSTERDHGLLSMVERLIRKPGEIEAKKAVIEKPAEDSLDPVIDINAAPAMLEPQIADEGESTCSRLEMVDLILRALRAIDGCPMHGFEVSIYGERPWNAMLRITPAAGPLRDAQAWRQRVRDMVPHLRNRYNLVD